MIFVVTNRRLVGGAYSDEEQPDHDLDGLYGHIERAPGSDVFAGKGKRGFKAALLRGLLHLRNERGVQTPKAGIYLPDQQSDWQASIDELVDLHTSLTGCIGHEPLLIGFSWVSSDRLSKDLSDSEEASGTIRAFTHFLAEVDGFFARNERSCFSSSFCIAHARGNYLLRKGLEYVANLPDTRVGRAMFDETVLLAPDLASQDIEFNGKGFCISRFSRRVHVYYSKHDNVLADSNGKGIAGNRLGHHGADTYENLPANVVIVNAEKYANLDSIRHADLKGRRGESVSVHNSYRYHPAILTDVVHVLSRVNEALIPTRHSDPKAQTHLCNHYLLV